MHLPVALDAYAFSLSGSPGGLLFLFRLLHIQREEPMPQIAVNLTMPTKVVLVQVCRLTNGLRLMSRRYTKAFIHSKAEEGPVCECATVWSDEAARHVLSSNRRV
jgi:hypothetical protein